MIKLHSFFNKLSTTELKRFQIFVESAYFNKRIDVRLLFEHYLKSNRKKTSEDLFKQVFPDQPFKKKDWHLLCSRLFKLGEQFLITEELNADKTRQKLLLLQAYRKKKQQTAFKSTISSAEKELSKQRLRDADFWQKRYDLAYEYFDFVASHDRKSVTNLQEVNDTLNSYFITNKLKTACLAMARWTIKKETYDIHLLEEVLDFLKKHPEFLETPSVQIYYLCYKAITGNENENWFTELRHAIELHQNKFHAAEQRDIFLLATNYCIRRLNEGKVIFIREAFELYRLSLDAGFLIEDGIISESTFGNIVTLAAKLEEYDWANWFVETYSPFLKKIFQTPLYHYSLGVLLYRTNQYDESMRQLAQVDTKAGFLLLGTKVLQIKIYFEQKEWDALEYLLESLRVYLQRRKDLGYRKRNYEMLIYFVRKLMELPYLSDAKKAIFLKELNEAEGLTEKEWLEMQAAK